MKKIQEFVEKRTWIVVIFILLFGFVVRLYKIDNPIADWHSWRQADTASVSKNYVKDGINILFPRYHDVSSIQTGLPNPQGYRFVEFPLYNVVHAVFARQFPFFSLEVWGRLVSIFSSLISALMLYFLGKRYFGTLGGLLASFFFCFIPYNIYFSRVILPEPMATCLALVALVLFVNFTEKDKSWLMYLSGLFLSLAILVKPFTIFYGIVMFYLFVSKYGFWRSIKNIKLLIKVLILVDIILVPFLTWRAWIYQFPAGIPFTGWMFNGDGIRFRPAFWRWIFIERLGNLILGIWGLPLFVIGASFVKKGKYFIQIFLLAMLFYVSIFATVNVRHDYYQIFIIPAVCLALAGGVVYLQQARELNRYISNFFVGFSILLSFLAGWYQIKGNYNINHPEIVYVGKEVDKLILKDALVAAPYNGDTAFLYQTNHWGWPAIDGSFADIIKKGASYYVSINLNDADTKFVREHFRVIKENDQFMLADLHQIIKPLPKK